MAPVLKKIAQEKSTGRMTLSTQVKIYLGVTAIVLVGLMSVGTWFTMSYRNRQGVGEQAVGELQDLRAELHELADEFLLQTTTYIANTLETYEKATEPQLYDLLSRFAVSEIHLVDTNGVIVKTTVPTDRGWRMADGEQSGEFLRLLNGEKNYAQPLVPKSSDGSLARYAATVFPTGGGFAEIGLNKDAYYSSLAQRVHGMTRSRHLRSTGYILLIDSNDKIISAPRELEDITGKALKDATGLSLTEFPRNEVFRTRVCDRSSFCFIGAVDGFTAVIVQPTREILAPQLEQLAYVVGVTVLVLLAVMFIGHLFLERLVTNPVAQMAESMNRIVSGQYDALAEVRTSSEFASLTDNVKAVVQLQEKAREKQAELARERDRMVAHDKAKSLFFSSVSHDIRTPLNAIIGFSELLDQDGRLHEEARDQIRMIRASGRMLLELVNDVLDLSKLEAGKMEIVHEPTDVAQIVSEILPVFDPQITSRHQRLVSEVPTMPVLMLDPHRLKQVLFNLISNSVKYAGSCTIRVQAFYSGGTFSMTVSDDGAGLDAEAAAKLMEPYAQAKSEDRKNGTGLGLSICKTLIEKVNGSFTLKTAQGEGFAFTFIIPNIAVAAREEPVDINKAASNATPETPVFRLPENVLVVDDSAVNRAVLKAMLKKLGVTLVSFAEDGRQALDKLMSESPFDCVLTDMWMPVMDGAELIKRIRADERLSAQKVCSVTADVGAMKTFKNLGFNDILLKPVTIEKLSGLFGRVMV